METTALITGASSGIGLELARIHASAHGNLILVARNLAKLSQLKNEFEKEFKIKVEVIGMDLSKPGAAEELFAKVNALGLNVDLLINNAGFGDFTLFHEADWKKTEEMLNVNILALTRLTHLVLPGMIKRKSGRIMNLASTAAFQPGPLMAVYYASKAYVLHFSEAIANELKGTGVTVTALCPGATESGFQSAAAMEESALVKGKKLPTSKAVAEYGYKAMMKGKAVAIHGFGNALLANAVRFFPRALVVKMTRMVQDKAR
jgi:short-subunit dehydrogenase